ncbi:MAG: tRNA pseudouridine(13) synthase TruD [Gammaproteobacteria bacterium]|nr:tRNA pseudouridine(13) synthase TruD [Gammaproteobacteria bacterium]MYD81055.1 tRNA pseudouridine(13) synthase TruD [Gammaproteobacteria bacterium]
MQFHRPTGVLRARISDFHVSELLDCNFTDEGEHLFLEIEKSNLNTREVQDFLCKHYQVPRIDVSYSGLKDKRAIAQQWFSVRLPKTSQPPSHPCFKILRERRHSRKLRIGSHRGNQFTIVVRQLSDDNPSLIEGILRNPVPNYFGPQRFGRNFKNVDRALNWTERPRSRIDRTIRYRHVTTLRSFLFNEVLAKRVRSGTWNCELSGDVLSHGLPTGPLWGRGRLPTTEDAAKIEESVGIEHQQVCEALEWVGLRQERRSLSVQPSNAEVLVSNETLTLRFTLPRGCFATAVVNECVDVTENAQ